MLKSTIQVKKRRVVDTPIHQNYYIPTQLQYQPQPVVQFCTPSTPVITFNKAIQPTYPLYPGQEYEETKVERKKIFGEHQGQEWEKAQAKEHQFNLFNLNNFDFANYLEQQIIQMEESPARRKIEELKKKGQKFVDERFPPNQNSLCGEWKAVPEWNTIKWNKLSHVMPHAKIFKGRPVPNDIKQGTLGDCYFLAGLAAICERPDRIYNLFLTQEQNEQKYFSVKMLYKGKWMVIDIDEYIPFQGNAPAFSKSINGELWVILLEKAWAKLYTSYKRIESGFPQQTLHDLTGAPIHSIEISKSMNKQNEWNYLMKATQRQYAMVCSSKPGSDTQTSQSGVVQGHAYTLLAAVVLNFKGQSHRLIKLRNPWGKVQFKGQWSDYDPNWNYVDPRQKQRLGYSNNKDDGVFFMGYDSFCQQFKSITVGEINDNASYVYKSAKDHNREGCYFRIQIKKEGVYSLQVDKTPERAFEQKRQDAYRYPRAIVDLAEFKQYGVQRLQGVMSSNRTTFLKYKLTPGTYIAKVVIEFNPQYETDYDVNLAIYAEYPCIIDFASNHQASKMEGRQVSWKGQQQHVNVPQMWNRLGCWGYKQKSHEEEQASFILDMNWPNSKPGGQVKGYEMVEEQGTAWNALSNSPLSNLISNFGSK